MVAVSHQMVALVAALYILTLYPHAAGAVVASMSVVAVMIGALTPDIDHPTARVG